MYILLYVDQNKQPCFIQGSIQEINEKLRTVWLAGEIDQEDWEYYSNYTLLGLEDGILTPVSVWDQATIPQVSVD